jgi:DNA-directed RNA polymerase subunit L
MERFENYGREYGRVLIVKKSISNLEYYNMPESEQELIKLTLDFSDSFRDEETLERLTQTLFNELDQQKDVFKVDRIPEQLPLDSPVKSGSRKPKKGWLGLLFKNPQSVEKIVTSLLERFSGKRLTFEIEHKSGENTKRIKVDAHCVGGEELEKVLEKLRDFFK